MDSSPHIDDIISLFVAAKAHADAHGHGNASAVTDRIIRDLEALRVLPAEAFAPPSAPEALDEVDKTETADVNTQDPLVCDPQV